MCNHCAAQAMRSKEDHMANNQFTFTTQMDRFMSHVSPEPNSGCWIWTATGTRGGYGMFRTGTKRDGSNKLAHRVAYVLLKGPIPHGLHLDHLCRVRCCVNPDHLEPVTNKENCRRGNTGIACAAKTVCPAGHPYDLKNTAYHYRGPDKTSVNRICLECCKLRQRARRLLNLKAASA